MRFATLLVLSLTVAASVQDPPSGPPLHVLRFSPTTEADPTSVVTVTFDRPVAGQLSGTVDPNAIFSIAPPVPGTVEWQDPITLRFTPDRPLVPTTSYTVTVSDSFQAMDGGRLDGPFQFTFRVGGPRVVAGSPAGPGLSPHFLTPDARFEMVLTAPAPPEAIDRLVYLELDNTCNGPSVVHVHADSGRPLTAKDPWSYRYLGRTAARAGADSLRRVVTLVPDQPLPSACSGRLVTPRAIDITTTAPMQKWPWATYGPFRLAGVTCWSNPLCPAGYAVAKFTTPVRGADILRAVRLVRMSGDSAPMATAFTVDDTTDLSPQWPLEVPLRPHTRYAVAVDSTLRDVFGQPLQGRRVSLLTTTGYASSVDYPTGSMLVERRGFQTIFVRHTNVDSLFVTEAAVPESLEAAVLGTPSWQMTRVWTLLKSAATHRVVPLQGPRDTHLVSALRVPAYDASRPGAPTLTAIRVATAPGDSAARREGTALVQTTDIGIAARLGREDAAVWVTTVHDGAPLAGASVVLYGRHGEVRASGTSDAQGLVHFTALPPDTADTSSAIRFGSGFEGYVTASHGNDRAVVAVDAYSWELSPWQFNVSPAPPNMRLRTAAAVFTERGIYRPGETVHAKAIVRVGALGALKVPDAGDSIRWVFHDRERGVLRDTVVTPSTFGTATADLSLAAGLPLGMYRVGVELRRDGAWTEMASTTYRVAEYRPPEFLVDVSGDTAARFAGDSLEATVTARYLFGAPMGRAAVRWIARRAPVTPWELHIPGTDGWTVGETGWWWEDEPGAASQSGIVASGGDTLDAAGRIALDVPLGRPTKGRPARVTLEATVTDVNRQTVTATTSVIVHPASFYVAAKPRSTNYFWKAGAPETVEILAVRPDGRRVRGVRVEGTLVRREWHRVERERGGFDEQVGEWVADTVAHCAVRTTGDPVGCPFTPPEGGWYVLTFRAHDRQGRDASTSFYRWATGKGWVPWNDENKFKMDVIPDKTTYNVGDTATVLFASPFTNAEAWITVEREGLITQRRLRITSGATSLKFPLTEAYVPNVYVSIVVARGRIGKPGRIDDPGRPAIRVGYAELRVTPAVKRLAVDVHPLAAEYRPGDSARVRVRVRDAGGVGRRSEVTLWAVDEGVLALTGYKTPDPVALIYRPRGVGMHLASNLTSVAAQVLPAEGISIKGDQRPGGGGGAGEAAVLRSRFSPVAFFLGSVVTDSTGTVVAAARLPDNLTTFRVMAVAVTHGDRYGSGESTLLVTRPLLARPALPRFLRRGDRFTAGAVVNQRAGGTPTVTVDARPTGAVLEGPATKSATLAAGRGAEVRFAFRDTSTDAASFRFDVTDGHDSDAVLTRLPVRPAYFPRAHTASGVVQTVDTVDIPLPDGIDPVRSTVTFGLGTTPLAVIGGMYRALAVYPYDCTEQLADEMLPLVALMRAGNVDGRSVVPPHAMHQLTEGVAALIRRQRADGGIGLWSADDWTTPWLSAYAGEALLAARDAGATVDSAVLAKLGQYLFRSAHQTLEVRAPVASWYSRQRVRLADRVAAADYLSRLGHPDIATENELLRVVGLMAWEDRVRLAEVVARRGATDAARAILIPIWRGVRIEGRRAVLPDSAVRPFYFWSTRRPLARLLSATLAVDSTNALIGPLVETLVERGRRAQLTAWNTQDYGAAAEALAEYTVRQRRAARRGFTVKRGNRVVFRSSGGGDVLREQSRPLSGLASPAPGGGARLELTIAAGKGATLPLFYYVTVTEVPRKRPVTPDQQGIEVERWYEDYTTGKPIVSAPEGALVRVRLRITIPDARNFLVLTDPLPAGLEAVDLSLKTVGGLPGPAAADQARMEAFGESHFYLDGWYYGSWDNGWWSPFDHREMRDDRVTYVATYLWPGVYTASYVARATTPGVFIRPPAHAEEMYNPAVQGRSDGGVFTVRARQP